MWNIFTFGIHSHQVDMTYDCLVKSRNQSGVGEVALKEEVALPD